MKFFPIMTVHPQRGQVPPEPVPASLPFAWFKAREAQCLYNHSQTPERLAERGGLSPMEALAVLRGVHWGDIDGYSPAEVARALNEWVREKNRELTPERLAVGRWLFTALKDLPGAFTEDGVDVQQVDDLGDGRLLIVTSVGAFRFVVEGAS